MLFSLSLSLFPFLYIPRYKSRCTLNADFHFPLLTQRLKPISIIRKNFNTYGICEPLILLFYLETTSGYYTSMRKFLATPLALPWLKILQWTSIKKLVAWSWYQNPGKRTFFLAYISHPYIYLYTLAKTRFKTSFIPTQDTPLFFLLLTTNRYQLSSWNYSVKKLASFLYFFISLFLFLNFFFDSYNIVSFLYRLISVGASQLQKNWYVGRQRDPDAPLSFFLPHYLSEGKSLLC